MSDISVQEPSHSIGEFKKALSSVVGEAEVGSKVDTTQTKKKKRSVNKYPSCKINEEHDIKTVTLNLSKEI